MHLRSCFTLLGLGALGLGAAACAADESRDEVYWDETGKADDPAVEGLMAEAFAEEDPIGCGNASIADDALPGVEVKADAPTDWKLLETEHFEIRFQTEGDNKVLASFLDLSPRDGVPDFVNHVAEGAEAGYRTYVDDWGFPPAGDKTPIWIKDAQEYFGYATQGQIVIDNDSFAFAISRHFLRATAAHEYFHIVQLNLAKSWSSTDKWLTESSAVWAEQQATGLWDGLVGGFIRDLLLNDRLRRNLHKSLTETDLLAGPYSTFVFPQFLAEHFDGAETIKSVFTRMGEGHSAMSAVDAVAKEQGTSFEEAFREHTLWNYLVGNRDDGAHYSDGRSFFHGIAGSTVEAKHSRLPTEWQDGESKPARYAASYVELDVPANAEAIQVELEASEQLDWAVSLLIRRGESWESRHPEPASGGNLSLVVDNLDGADRVVLAVQQLGSLQTEALAFRYRASE